MMFTLGAVIEHIGPREIDLRAAGAVASLADSANGYAAFTLAPADFDVLAVEFKINLLAPARADPFGVPGRGACR
jgi:acyl-coenzyme A thioesterase PaaI-like protein